MRWGRLLPLAALPFPAWALSENMRTVLTNMGGMTAQFSWILMGALTMVFAPYLMRRAIALIKDYDERVSEEAYQERVDDFFSSQSPAPDPVDSQDHGFTDARGAALGDTVVTHDWHAFLYGGDPTPGERMAMEKQSLLMADALSEMRQDVMGEIDDINPEMSDVWGPGDPPYDDLFKQLLDERFSFLGDQGVSDADADPADDPAYVPSSSYDHWV